MLSLAGTYLVLHFSLYLQCFIFNKNMQSFEMYTLKNIPYYGTIIMYKLSLFTLSL